MRGDVNDGRPVWPALLWLQNCHPENGISSTVSTDRSGFYCLPYLVPLDTSHGSRKAEITLEL
jgi:hypothetical protein